MNSAGIIFIFFGIVIFIIFVVYVIKKKKKSNPLRVPTSEFSDSLIELMNKNPNNFSKYTYTDEDGRIITTRLTEKEILDKKH